MTAQAPRRCSSTFYSHTSRTPLPPPSPDRSRLSFHRFSLASTRTCSTATRLVGTRSRVRLALAPASRPLVPPSPFRSSTRTARSSSRVRSSPRDSRASSLVRSRPRAPAVARDGADSPSNPIRARPPLSVDVGGVFAPRSRPLAAATRAIARWRRRVRARAIDRRARDVARAIDRRPTSRVVLTRPFRIERFNAFRDAFGFVFSALFVARAPWRSRARERAHRARPRHRRRLDASTRRPRVARRRLARSASVSALSRALSSRRVVFRHARARAHRRVDAIDGGARAVVVARRGARSRRRARRRRRRRAWIRRRRDAARALRPSRARGRGDAGDARAVATRARGRSARRGGGAREEEASRISQEGWGRGGGACCAIASISSVTPKFFSAEPK